MMNQEQSHISSYTELIKVLIALLFLTLATITVTSFELKTWNVILALLIACTKVFLVLTYFMHLKHENRFLRGFTMMTFALFVIVMIITFFDYLYR